MTGCKKGSWKSVWCVSLMQWYRAWALWLCRGSICLVTRMEMLPCGFHLLKSTKQRRPLKNRHGGADQAFPPLQYKVKNSPEKADNPRGSKWNGEGQTRCSQFFFTLREGGMHSRLMPYSLSTSRGGDYSLLCPLASGLACD